MNGPILVPLDGSRGAEHCLPAAIRLARAAQASLCLAHVQSAALHAPEERERSAAVGRAAGAEEPDRAYLAAVREQIAAGAPSLQIDLAVLPPLAGSAPASGAAARLADWAARSGCSWMVLSAAEEGGSGCFRPGGVAAELARATPLPLLMYHRRQGRAPGSAFRRILLPLDGSRRAEAVIEHALRLGRPDHAAYTLLRVVPPAQSGDQAREYLETVAERLRQEGAQAEPLVVAAEQPAAAILETADRSVADLIALTTYGQTGNAALPGSVADRVFRGTPLPLLVVHPRESAR